MLAADESSESHRIPDWAARERLRDMEWIGEDLHIFWPVGLRRSPSRGEERLWLTPRHGQRDRGIRLVISPKQTLSNETMKTSTEWCESMTRSESLR